MNNLDLQQVLSMRYRTSHQADAYTEQLRKYLNLETKAQVARLAIGRSLAMGPVNDEGVDSKGLDIPAQAMFSAENIGAWVGLLTTHSLLNGGPAIDSSDALRVAIRTHWHRGAVELWRDWMESGEDYNKFLETLIARRSEMPEIAVAVRDDGEAHGDAKSEAPQDVSHVLTRTLDELGIKVQVKDALHGPRMTRYRVVLVNLVDSAKLNRNMSQLALALSLGNKLPTVCNGDEARTVFIDVPRPRSSWVTVGLERLRDWAQAAPRNPNALTVYAGVAVTGEDVTFDLAGAPHLLVGGTTGSGKSICLHSLILSLLLRHSAETLQLALIDPKRVDFAPYAKLPNLYRGAIATEVSQAREMLEELVAEMEARYTVLSQVGAANIGEARRKGQHIPYIVVFIEEMADLVMNDKSCEDLIARLAQKARAAGIHLVLATQRPDAQTFSGLIRSNVPSRIALTVRNSSESNIILGDKGAEHLLGAGDMLLRLPGEPLKRVHSVFVRSEQLSQMVAALR